MENFLLTLVGILAGGLITHIYDRRSLKGLQELKENLLAEFRQLRDQIASTQPDTAQKITKIIQKYNYGSGAEPGVIGENDICPTCKKQTLKFSHYGVGPLGVNNAWYECKTCGYRFQIHETVDD